MNLTGLLIGAATFFCIGVFHPIVIKAEYHFGRKCWWAFLLLGLVALVASLMITNTYASIKTSFKQDGGSHKFVDKHIGQRKFTVDAMAVLYNPLFDIYVKYSPQDVLKEPSVNFHALTVGIYL